MNSSGLTYIIRFVALLATQILVLNKVQFSGYLNPYIYFLFILMLPLRTPPLVMIITGFLMGLFVDFYSGLPGIHAASTLFIAYFRNRIIKVVIGVREEDFVDVPGLRNLGLYRFIYYAGVMTLIHHLILFFLEVFTFNNAFETLYRAVINSIVSLLFMIITLVLFEKKKNE